jgi:hypothetical protein
MARWPTNAHPIIVMAAIAISLYRILIGIVGSIAISSDCTWISVNGGFIGGLNGGLNGGFNGVSFDPFQLVVLGY